jgi:hypothetical protein
MASLNDVRAALAQGDKTRAHSMLKDILQREPSAEAWYLAAQIAGNREMQVRYLQRVLAFDNNHARARLMLRKLGEREVDLLDSIKSASANVDVESGLRGAWTRIPRPAKLALAALMVIIPLLIIVPPLLSAVTPLLAAPTATPTPPPTPTERPFLVWTPQTMADVFMVSGLNISIDEVETGVSANSPLVQGRVVLDYTDSAGDDNEVRVVFYNTLEDAASDRPRLEELGWVWGPQNANAVLIYKPGIPDGDLAALLAAFNSVLQPPLPQAMTAVPTPPV